MTSLFNCNHGRVLRKRLAAFFFVDQINYSADTHEHKQYSNLCKQLMLLKGALEAVFDGRNWSKSICALVRACVFACVCARACVRTCACG